MRETYSTILQTTKDFCIDDSSTSTNSLSSSDSFLATQINATIQYLYAQIRNYKTQPLPRTFNTVASQIYYHVPSDLINIESLTITVGSIKYPLKPINSQDVWDRFQQLDFTSSSIPQYYFPRQYDFGIYPTPASILTGTMVGNYLPQKLSVADYTSGTVVVTQNSATVTGTDTTFTTAMIGRWFRGGDGGRWYKITSFTSTTVVTLETVFEETSISASTFVIAQSPEIPEELHEYIPYRAAAVYYSTVRRDAKYAQTLMNFFYTGDFYNANRGGGIKGGILGVINRYKQTGRSNSMLTTLHKSNYVNNWRDEAWATELS